MPQRKLSPSACQKLRLVTAPFVISGIIEFQRICVGNAEIRAKKANSKKPPIKNAHASRNLIFILFLGTIKTSCGTKA
jgi:hypothetical protein